MTNNELRRMQIKDQNEGRLFKAARVIALDMDEVDAWNNNSKKKTEERKISQGEKTVCSFISKIMTEIYARFPIENEKELHNDGMKNL